MGLRSSASASRASFTLKPAMALSASSRAAFASSRMLCRRLYAISGSMTFSWKLPDCPARVMVASLPITCAATMVAAQVIGNDATITLAGQSGNFQLNVMLPLIAYNLLQSIRLLANAARLLADNAIAGFKVNEARLAEALERNPILVTALNPVIGYEKGAAIAKKAYAEGRAVLDVAAEMTGLSRAQLERLLDPAELTRGGIKGGTSGGG